MATYLHSYELEGKKESVANTISMISPEETPFCTMSPKVGEHNNTFSWLADELPTAAVGAGVAEGADAVDTDAGEPTKYTSFTQIFQRTAKVSGTAEAIGLYGRGKAMAYRLMKEAKKLKLDIEMSMLSDQSGVAAGSGAAGKLDGFATKRADSGNLKVARVANVKQAATAKTFNEEELKDLLDDMYIAGAKPSVIMFPPKYARAFSALRSEQGTAMYNMLDGKAAATINRQVTIYIDHYGNTMKCIPNRLMPEDKIYVFEPSMFKQHVLRNFFTRDLAIQGDYVRKQLVVELGLENSNPKAAGIYSLKA